MARSGMLEAKAAGNKHFERGAQLKAQLRREAKEEKKERALRGILPVQEELVEVTHPGCPDDMELA